MCHNYKKGDLLIYDKGVGVLYKTARGVWHVIFGKYADGVVDLNLESLEKNKIDAYINMIGITY